VPTVSSAAEPGIETTVRPLLDHLAEVQPTQEDAWQDWQISRVTGGRNNLLYRASGRAGALVVKFTVADGRDRAGREYESQSALQRAGLAIAPEPLLLDRVRYRQPVIVSTWVEGIVSETPPGTEAGWRDLVQHLASVHSVVPQSPASNLRPPTIHAATAEEGKRLVQEQVSRLPDKSLPTPLRTLLRRLEARPFPDWPPAPVRLCRLDNNVDNFIRRPGSWASVDWEYSGWGDPAFDLGNLLTHVSFLGVPAARWAWVLDTYSELAEDAGVAIRAEAYRQILLVWWVARLARYLYEIPRGRDERLVAWPEDWQVDVQAKYERFVQLAEGVLS
jgi:aminoglycoside phosphotransferase (APT) family kinase protein